MFNTCFLRLSLAISVAMTAFGQTYTPAPASQWDVAGAGDSTIQGFTTDISFNVGETVSFKVNTAATAYRLDIYRMGYYGGNGAAFVTTVRPSVSLPQSQPACVTNSATGLVDCGNWAVSASWSVPATAKSGIYFAKVVRESGAAGASHIMFVVRDDASHSAILFQTSDTTWQAYNQYGGNSLYVGSPAGRAYKVSYNRPFTTRSTSPEDWVFNAEYPMVRWLEANGYDVTYTTGLDTQRRGQLITNHKVFMSVGHDEYWSAGQRASVEAARNAGVNLAFLSGNLMFWKTRWENSIDGSGTPYRTLVCYKETHANAKIDPLSNVWTGTWRDPRFSPPADGGRPENALTGLIFTVNDPGGGEVKVSQAEGRSRFWRNTSFAQLAAGATGTLATGTAMLAYEWDEDLNNGFRPPGLMRLSSSTVTGLSYLKDYGSTYGSGTGTHSFALYRHSSGALVFSAGTVQYSWGLDNNHDRTSAPTDSRLQQATVNLLADMGVQPATLQSGLLLATASTDVTPPIATITSPAAGSTVPLSPMTVRGTASDVGGVVTAVEVSTDGGATWNRVSGRESWTYDWTPSLSGPATILSRGIDDSGNIQTPATAINVTVGGSAACPCTIWNDSATPGTLADPDSVATELGLKFRSDVAGYITGIRFYKSSTNTGTHQGSIWNRTGTRLASVTFAGETASGWQTALLTTPVAIAANTTYVVSYNAPNGHYSTTTNFFTNSGVNTPPLRALQSGVDGTNGVYSYGPAGTFPTLAWLDANYSVDVIFNTSVGADTTAPVITAVTAAPGLTTATLTWTTDEDASSRVDYGSTTALGSSASDAALVKSHTLALTGLASGTTYYYRVSSADGANNSSTLPVSGNPPLTFATDAVDTTPPAISGIAATAGGTTATVAWTTNEASTSRIDYGTSPGLLTSAITSATMATAHAVNLPNLEPGTTYYYRVTSADTAGNPATSPDISLAPLSFSTTPPDSVAPVISAVAAAPASMTAAITWTTDEATDSRVDYGTSTALGSTAALPAMTTAHAITLTGLTPGATYYFRVTSADASANTSTSPVTVNPPASFTTSTATVTKVFADSATPATIQDPDTAAVELGMKFRADVNGTVTGVRFYKGANNTGLHVGNLWSSTGTLLATVTFSGETASGWQQASFPSPVNISAGQTYVISYHAPNGRYSSTGAYFTTSGAYKAPLYALRNGVDGSNSVYKYGSAGSFPTATYNGSNYWVDVVFTYVPSATATVYPAAATIESGGGTLRGGTAAAMNADENTFYEVNSTTTGSRSVSWYATFTGIPKSVASLSVSYVGKESRSCTETLSLMNFLSNSWVQIYSGTVSTGEVLRANIPAPGVAADFVSGTGEVRVRTRCTGPTANFFSSADLMSVSYR